VRGFFLSFLIHAGLIVGGFIYLPKAVQQFETPPIVPIDLVTLADMTSLRAAAPEPEEVPEDVVEDDTIEDEIIDPVPTPEPEPELEAEVEVIDAEPEVEPEPVEEEPEPDPEPVQPQPERIVQPPAPTPAQPSLSDMLGDLEREVAEARTETGTPDEGDTRQSVGDGERMTATISDLINSQTSRCWRTSIDAPDAQNLVIVLEIRLDRDGSLAMPPVLQDEYRIRNSANPYLRVAAERAIGAVVDCAPYRLPAESYSQWRHIDVGFTPQ
jgi:outer membrane biosynthesis protein TonB